MIMAFLLILLIGGTTLTTATQLRISGLPVGAGELMLLVWMAWMWGAALMKKGYPTKHSIEARAFGLFWSVCLGAMLMGMLLSTQANTGSFTAQLHDGLAYGFSFAICMTLACFTPSTVETRNRLLGLAGFSILVGTLLWFLAHLSGTLGVLSLWYADVRFSGWAKNPNQMAFLLLLSPFIGLLWLQNNKLTGYKYALIVFLVASATAAGWATDSGALRGAWLITFPLYTTKLIIDVALGRHGAVGSLRDLSLIVLCASCLVVLGNWHEQQAARVELSASKYALQHITQPQDLALVAEKVKNAQNILSEKGGSQSLTKVAPPGDISVRQKLLKNGVEAWSKSLLFGHGPGAFSGLALPFEGSESHNSLLDWATNAGAIGVFALVLLVIWLFCRLWKAQQWVLIVGLLCIAIFAQAHHVLRQPLLWFWLVTMAQLSSPVEGRSRPESV